MLNDLPIMSQRLAFLMERDACDQVTLAQAVGIKQPAISDILKGKTQNSRHIHKIAAFFGSSVDWLLGLSEEQDNASPTILIPQLDIGYSMGGGSEVDERAQSTMVPMLKAWIKPRMKGHFSDLFLAYGAGDSMEPTLRNGDMMLIDRAQQRITAQDQIWCISYGHVSMIKRVRALADGGHQINSDNATVTPWTAYDGEMHVIGRVIWIGRWM